LLNCSGGCGTRPSETHTPHLAAELEQSSPKSPEQPALLGGAQGSEIHKDAVCASRTIYFIGSMAVGHAALLDQPPDVCKEEEETIDLKRF